MAIQLGSAYGKVGLDVSGLLNGIKQGKAGLSGLATAGQQLGNTMRGIGTAMTLGLTLPIVGIGAASIKAASDLEETRNKVKVVFGEMSDDVLAWSEDSARAFGQSRQQALEAAGTFGNLFTSMGLGRQEAAEMSRGLVELSADMASFNNIDPSIVLEKLRSGLVGEVEPLRTLGVNLTMATVKAKAMEMGLADANGEVSQSALLQARYALILEQTTNAQGDFARTSDGLANSTRIMRAEMQDALAMLGTHLLPIALAVVQGLNRMLEAFSNLSPGMQKAIIIFAGFLAILGPILTVVGTVISFISSIVGLVGGLSTLGISLGAIAAAAGAAGTAIVGFAAAALSVILPLLLIAGTIYLVYLAFKNNFMGITTTAQQLWFIIKWAFGQIWLIITQTVQSIIGWFEMLKYKMTLVFEDGSGLLLDLAVAFGFPKKAAQEFLAAIFGIIERFRNGMVILYEDGSGLLLDLAMAFGIPKEAAQEFLMKVWDAIHQFMNNLRSLKWSDVGKFILFGIANGMLGGIPMLVVAATRAAMAALAAIKRALGISSPSKETFKLGMQTAQGYMLGMRGGLDPNAIAQMMARPVLNQSTSSQQNITMQFGNGVTMHQAQRMIAENNEILLARLNYALGGA